MLDLAFALSVMGFLIMHISLVASNTTTIEVISMCLVSIFLTSLSFPSIFVSRHMKRKLVQNGDTILVGKGTLNKYDIFSVDF